MGRVMQDLYHQPTDLPGDPRAVFQVPEWYPFARFIWESPYESRILGKSVPLFLGGYWGTKYCFKGSLGFRVSLQGS